MLVDTFKEATPVVLAAIREEMKVRGTTEVFLFFPMGSQFDHLIVLLIAMCGVYCVIADPASVTAEDVVALAPIGIIISGGPASVHAEPPPFDSRIFDFGIPTFGICLGFQMWAKHVGSKVVRGRHQFGAHDLMILEHSPLFADCPNPMKVLQSHGDEVVNNGAFTSLAISNDILAGGNAGHLYGVQFHPECTETVYGKQIFENFLFKICGAKDRFAADDAAQRKIDELVKIRKSGKRILILLSGGCDSSIVAFLCKAAGFDRTNCRGVYIEGVDRPDDKEYVQKHFGNQDWIEVVYVDATDRLLATLVGKTSMGEKRKDGFKPVYNAIGGEQAELFSEGGTYEVLVAQGTIYTDKAESGLGHQSGARKAVIKVHHNTGNEFRSPRTGELFAELTPLDDQVKDTGRAIGRSIGVPEELIVRHPFPGPGMVVRIGGEITREKLAIERMADGIWIEELRKADLYRTVWQAGASLLEAEHTFSKGDDAGSGPIVMLWAVYSTNGFTAQRAQLPNDFLDCVTQRICNEVPGIGAVCYRISNKPISTIEIG